MLRILHPTYQWGESAKKEAEQEEEEKPGSDIALCCVLLQKTKKLEEKKNKKLKKKTDLWNTCAKTPSFTSCCTVGLYPLRSGGKMQTRLRCSRSLVPFSCAHTHTVRGFFFFFFSFFLGAFLTPQLTRREKRKTPRTPDSFIEALKSQSCDWKNVSEWKRAC